MDLTKSYEFFDPAEVRGRCHVIGCGSVGSSVAEQLVRLGIKDITLYDFDDVEAHNVANQMYRHIDVDREKVEALRSYLVEIDPDLKDHIAIVPEGWTPGTRMSGYVFLCVDNIDTRRQICTENKMNHSIKAVFDFRTRLEDAQCYAAEWADLRQQKNLLASMDFTHDEAAEATPRTACGTELGVAPTVRICTAYGVANFVNYIKGRGLKKIIDISAFNFSVDAY